MIDGSQLGTTEICWLTSRAEEVFNVVEIVANTKELVDTQWFNHLFSQDSICSYEITQIENNLKELSTKALELRLMEKEILKEEEHICKMWEDFLDRKQKLVIAEGELRTSLDLKKKGKEWLQMELTEARYTKLHDLKRRRINWRIWLSPLSPF